jgi:hypothetical protein
MCGASTPPDGTARAEAVVALPSVRLRANDNADSTRHMKSRGALP